MSEIPYLKGKKLLIIEDDEFNFLIVKMSLSRFKFEITKADNGKEATEIFIKSPDYFDLIITDHDMPIMNGNEAAKIIKQINPKIKIILHTASLYKDELDKLDLSAIDEIIFKPTEPSQLRELICKYL